MDFGIALSIISILGAILNAKQNVYGFYIWIIANIGWIGYDLYFELYSQIPTWVVYTITSSYGIYQWNKIHKLKGSS